MSGANEGATSYLPVKISKGVRYVHRVTGKPLKMVAEEVLYTVDDEEGDPVEMSATQLRPARWYKPENIVEESLGYDTRHVPLYE